MSGPGFRGPRPCRHGARRESDTAARRAADRRAHDLSDLSGSKKAFVPHRLVVDGSAYLHRRGYRGRTCREALERAAVPATILAARRRRTTAYVFDGVNLTTRAHHCASSTLRVIWTRSANSHTGRRLSSCRIQGRTDNSIRPRAATTPTFSLAWRGRPQKMVSRHSRQIAPDFCASFERDDTEGDGCAVGAQGSHRRRAAIVGASSRSNSS